MLAAVLASSNGAWCTSRASSRRGSPLTFGKMSAFEIYVNDRHLCTAALQRDGALTAMVTFFRGVGPKGRRIEETKLSVVGFISDSETFLDWLPRGVDFDGEVKIVFTSKKRGDAPKARRRESKTVREQQEKDYIEKRARDFGWTIMK